jgi:hypothetical protein
VTSHQHLPKCIRTSAVLFNRVPVHCFMEYKRDKRLFFCNKTNRCTNFTNLFCHETLHISDSSSAHHQEFIHCTLSNGICHTDSFRAGSGCDCSSILVLLESCLQNYMVYTIAECTVNKFLMIDRGTIRNMYWYICQLQLGKHPVAVVCTHIDKNNT